MDCWVQITSGRGPEECGRAVFQIMTIFAKEAHEKNINVGHGLKNLKKLRHIYK
jgi:protein subunit release factor B